MRQLNKNSIRKIKILKEGARLFRQKGYEATTLRELAKESGIKGGSVYHHFLSKQDILYQIMDSTMTELISKLRNIIKDETNPITKLRKAINFHIKYHVNNKDETQVSDREIRSLIELNYDRLIKKRHVYETIFTDILKEGFEQGLMKTEHTQMVAFAILQMCTGISDWYYEEGPLSVDEIADIYFQFILKGVTLK